MGTFATYDFESLNIINSIMLSNSIPKIVKSLTKDIMQSGNKEEYDYKGVHTTVYKISNDEQVILDRDLETMNCGFTLISKRYPYNLTMENSNGVLSSIVPEPIMRNLPKDLESKMLVNERRIAGLPVECSLSFDKNGNVIGYSNGDGTTVTPFYSKDVIYATHSHPKIYRDLNFDNLDKLKFGGFFSSTDISSFLNSESNSYRQMRVIFPNEIVMVLEKTKPVYTAMELNRIKELFLKHISMKKSDKSWQLRNKLFMTSDRAPTEGENRFDQNRKWVKYQYDVGKNYLDSLGLHLYFVLKDGRKVERLQSHRTKVPVKNQNKTVLKKTKKATSFGYLENSVRKMF